MFIPRQLLSRWWKPDPGFGPGKRIKPEPASASAPCFARWRLDWLPSLGFWVCLALAALLGGGLALAPRALTGEELRERYRRNLTQITSLEREIAHWNQLAGRLRDDPQFVAQLAATEFGKPGVESVQVSQGDGLEFDPRNLTASPFPAKFAPASWTTPMLDLLAGDSEFQSRIRMVVGLLLILAVGCCHESFTSGRWTRGCLQMAARSLTRYIHLPADRARPRRS